MRNRPTLAAAVAALCVAAVPASAAARVPVCPVVTDPKGDATPPDASLDVTSVTYSKVGKDLAVTIKVDKLAENVSTAWGDRFQAEFNANDKAVEVYYKRSRTRNEEANVFYQSGLRVSGTFVSDAGIKAKHDLKASTVTITIALTSLKAGVGKSVDGAEISDLGASAQRSFIGTNNRADTVTSETSFKVAPCVTKK